MSILSVLTTFCALLLAWIFSFSAVRKGRDLSAFAQNIAGFMLVAATLVTPAALVFVALEAGVSLALLLFLIWPEWSALAFGGFGVAAGLLLLFSLALISVLFRGLAISCGCFGAKERPVSWLDVQRNAGLLLGALAGLVSLCVTPNFPALPAIVRLLLALMAAVCALLWTHLDMLLDLHHTHAA